MSIKILDGHGTGFEARINKEGRVLTAGISMPAIQNAACRGKAYNLQTSKINLTSAASSGIMYLQNNDSDHTVVLGELRTFLGQSNSPGDTELIMYANPTGGTLLTAGTAVTPVNRNFGLTVPALATAYEGAEGKTITGGVVAIAAIAQSGVGAGVQLYFVIPNGKSLAVSITPPTGNTSMAVRMRLNFFYDVADTEAWRFRLP